VSEWFKEHAWKACVPKGTGGSNPFLSAIRDTHLLGVVHQASLTRDFLLAINDPQIHIHPLFADFLAHFSTSDVIVESIACFNGFPRPLS
jgi:hypothetical protein